MRTMDSIFEEIPTTAEAHKIYMRLLDKEIKTVEAKLKRLLKFQEEASKKTFPTTLPPRDSAP